MTHKRPLSLSLTKDLLNEIDASWGDSLHEWSDAKTPSLLATGDSKPQFLTAAAQAGSVLFHETPWPLPSINTDLRRAKSPIPEVYRGIECLEEPLIELDSPTNTTPNKPFNLSNGAFIHTTRPLLPMPESDEALAWELATEVSLLDMSIEDFKNLHPVFQRQISEAVKRHMPEGSANADDTGRFSSHLPHNGDVVSEAQFRLGLTQLVDESREEPSEDTDDEWCCGQARRSGAALSYCYPCSTSYCDACWSRQRSHRQARHQTSAGIPHEKTDPAIAKQIEETLEADRDDEQQALLHIADEDTSWFGAGKDDQDTPIFQDYGRFANLMAERVARNRTRKPRYPGLVSFVGETGAGKSTLIRFLVDLQSTNWKPQVPVVGSVKQVDTPTSGDVHLYCDPKSFAGEQPVLYADCEGLDGGEREPMGAKSRHWNRRGGSSNDGKKKTTPSFTKHIRRQHNTSEREILWATTDEKCSREFNVRNLYPRLLYTFSDVIVFVTKNGRVIEKVIEQLIKWAAAALETSSNQPVLPHAIIVLNATANSTEPDLWDVNNSTSSLLESVTRAVHQNDKLRKYAEFWRSRQKSIDTIESLLLSYYSSVRVVRVPEPGRPNLIHDQCKRLYEEITGACRRSRASKHQTRMLLNADQLQPYLQYAIDHFCRDLDTPFDFVQASFANNPIPPDFGGNILKLAINIMEVWRDKLDGPHIFKELSFMVASCIMLDSARHRTLGPAEKLFQEYLEHSDDALEDFCDKVWPCEFVDGRGRCVNVKAGHNTKGHQLKNGQVLATGEYVSDFSAKSYREIFRNDIYRNLEKLLERLFAATKEMPERELQAAADIHKEVVLRRFFKHLNGPEKFISHSACFSCLISPPEHSLPCGHVLCTPCVKAYGTARGRTWTELRQCPLHEAEEQFETRWHVAVKPLEAGTRILCLDGGGIRGIVELTILQQIEKMLGGTLKIQSFLDLIVGTSTGGIIAIGLGSMGWSVSRCVQQFETLCKDAFKKRRGSAFPGVGFLVSSSNHSQYRTQPLEKALKDTFGSESFFGGSRNLATTRVDALNRTTKVAITTTTTSGTVFVLANYNRINTDDGHLYQFHRSEKPDREILTWEAARATAAAPRIFKPYDHIPSGNSFQDGALYHNNPIEIAMRERRLIWPENSDHQPDIVISIGTSFSTKPPSKRATLLITNARWGVISHVKQLAKIAIDHVLSTLDAERTWAKWVEDNAYSPRTQGRYIRLNVPLEHDPPKLDDVDAMPGIKNTASHHCSTKRLEYKAVADRLLATSFYFERSSAPPSRSADEKWTIAGTIICRFPPQSDEIKGLGEAMRMRSTNAYNNNYADHNPYFVIAERRLEEEAQQFVIHDHVVDRMIREGHFSLGQIKLAVSDYVCTFCPTRYPQVHSTNNSQRAETNISLCFGDQPKKPIFYSISGFPRCILEEDRRLTSKTRLSLELVRKRTPTQAHIRENWHLPTMNITEDPIDLYEDYVYPGAATRDDLSEISIRLSSPSPRRAGELSAVRTQGSDSHFLSPSWSANQRSSYGTESMPAEMGDSVALPVREHRSRYPSGTPATHVYEMDAGPVLDAGPVRAPNVD
jgi:predicted acylesterase/phospholipase RssA